MCFRERNTVENEIYKMMQAELQQFITWACYFSKNLCKKKKKIAQLGPFQHILD